MKTFEERYTAWIDGQLTGNSLTAFEQELARRAETGDAEAAGADKVDALHLRALLKEHLQAPSLTNTEFFNHQMRGRIDAEIGKAVQRRTTGIRPAYRLPAFAWPFARLAGAGVLCLFVAGALYYGMVPQHPDAGSKVASTTAVQPKQPTDPQQLVTNDSPAPQPTATDHQGPTQLVFLNRPTPAPLDLNDDIQTPVVTPSAGNSTSATPLRIGKDSVLWVDGLTYLPDVSTGSSSPTPASVTTPGMPAAVPSATP